MEESRKQSNDESGKKVKTYRKKRILIPVLLLALVAIAVAGYWYAYLRGFISTDDAYVDANQVGVSAKILGRINELTADEGDTVRQGELLVRLDDSDLQSQAAQEQQNIALNQENVSLATINLRRAETDFRRTSDLFKDSIVSWDQFDLAKKTFDLATAQHKVALAQVSASKAKLDVVQTQLQNTKITVPMTGVVAKKWVMSGDIVQPGQPIFTIYDLQNTWVTANFEETKLSSIHVNDPVQISVDAHPGIKFDGRVTLIGAVTASQFSLIPPDNASGNFTKVTQRVPVKISIERRIASGERDPVALLPGMSVEVRIRVRGHK
ncbi:MAG: HlyD family secretion protein [Candidatus Zixiibacteriota bacterium]